MPVDRKGGSQALKAMNQRAPEEKIAAGRQIIIFPEGNASPARCLRPPYKFGVAHLYAKLGTPCLPVALNSGLYLAATHSLSATRGRSWWEHTSDPEIGPGMPAATRSSTISRRGSREAATRLLCEGRDGVGAALIRASALFACPCR